jgi:hypothetical protein
MGAASGLVRSGEALAFGLRRDPGNLQDQLAAHGHLESLTRFSGDDESAGTTDDLVFERLLQVIADGPSAAATLAAQDRQAVDDDAVGHRRLPRGFDGDAVPAIGAVPGQVHHLAHTLDGIAADKLAAFLQRAANGVIAIGATGSGHQRLAERLGAGGTVDDGPGHHHILMSGIAPFDICHRDPPRDALADGAQHIRMGKSHCMASALEGALALIDGTGAVGKKHQLDIDLLGSERRGKPRQNCDKGRQSPEHAHRTPRRSDASWCGCEMDPVKRRHAPRSSRSGE